jgi:2-oxoglutarate ferredoxin oxidoreductase subunit alpha
LGEILSKYKKVLIPEINNGQLIKIIRGEYLVDAKAYNKIMGVPITKAEIIEAIKKHLLSNQ